MGPGTATGPRGQPRGVLAPRLSAKRIPNHPGLLEGQEGLREAQSGAGEDTYMDTYLNLTRMCLLPSAEQGLR